MVGSSACFAHSTTAAELEAQQTGARITEYTNVDPYANASAPTMEVAQLNPPIYEEAFPEPSAPPMEEFVEPQVGLPKWTGEGQPRYPDLYDMTETEQVKSETYKSSTTPQEQIVVEEKLEVQQKQSDTKSEEVIPNCTVDAPEVKEEPSFFSRIKSGCISVAKTVKNVATGVASATKTTVNAVSSAANTTLNVAAIGSAVVGVYGLYGIGNAISSHPNAAMAAGVIAASTAVMGSVGSFVENVQNEWHQFKTGSDLPEVAQKKRYQRFKSNIIAPAIKLAGALAFATGLYVAPVATLKFASPVIARAVVKNRLDKHCGKGNINSVIATALGLGVGIVVGPISTCIAVIERLK